MTVALDVGSAVDVPWAGGRAGVAVLVLVLVGEPGAVRVADGITVDDPPEDVADGATVGVAAGIAVFVTAGAGVAVGAARRSVMLTAAERALNDAGDPA